MGLIGTALGAIGSIWGGIQASKAMKEYKKNIETQRAQNKQWYDRRYNEDPMQRASAQALFTRVEDSIRNRNRAAAGTQAVMGGTQEALAATKAANNEALAQVASNVAINGEACKDAIEAQYLNRDAQYQQQLNDLEAQRAQNISQAIQGVADAASGDFYELNLKNGKTLAL